MIATRSRRHLARRRRLLVLVVLFLFLAETSWASAGGLAAPDRLQAGPPESVSAETASTVEADRSYEESVALLERVMDGIAKLRTQIDRTQFDLAALEEKVGPDAKNLIAFVRDEIAFEQYAGLLRGAQGTLMSRAGNGLDQAVLLSTLLEDAGYETRVARGTLDPSEAQSLFMQMATPRRPRPPIGELETMKKLLISMGTLAGMREEEIAVQVEKAFEPAAIESSEPYQAAQADAEFILETLARERVTLGRPGVEAEIMREAQDYFWLEYRVGPSDPWLAVHPAFADPNSSPQVDPEEFLSSDSIPETLQHRFRVRVVNEQVVSGEPKTYEVMEWWERPAAELVGIPLTFYNYPSGLSEPEDLADLPKLYEKTELFIPTFNDRLADPGKGFDRDGETYGLKILASGQLEAERTGKEIGKKLEGFAGILGALGSEEPAPTEAQTATLSAQWIEYALIGPGGEETVYRRSVLDRIDPDARAAKRFVQLDDRGKVKIGQALTRQHTFMLAPGRYPEAYALDRILERILNGRPIFELALRKTHFPDEKVSLAAGIPRESAWLGHLMLYTAFDEGVPAESTSYRPEPTLAVYERPLGSALRVRLSLDIVNNSRRAFQVADRQMVAAPDDVVRAGTWETRTEQFLLTDATVAPAMVERFNTVEAFRQAKAASIPLRVLRASDRSKLGGLSLPAVTRVAISADLAAGYVVLVPEALPIGSTTAGWWRIDPTTGETLGMAADGRGAELVEYLVVGQLYGLLAWNACLVATSVKNACNCAFVGLGVGFVTVGTLFAAAAAATGPEISLGTTSLLKAAGELCR